MKRFLVATALLALILTGVSFGQQSSWQVVSPLPTVYPLNAVTLINRDTLVAVGAYGSILTSFNAGITWTVEEAVLADTENIYDVQFLTNQLGWAAGDNGSIFRTTNGGVTWTSLTFPLSHTILSLNFISPSIGWVCGNGGIIYKTTNGGETWSKQTSGTIRDLFAIKFVTAQNGFCFGGRGTILRTTNGGTDWVKTVIDSTRSIYACSFISPTQGHAVGAFGYIIRTTDGGATWTRQRSPFQSSLYSVQFLTADLGWACGSLGTVIKTSDGGQTWVSKLDELTDDLFGIRFTTASQGWAVGDNGRIVTSTDGGETWSLLSSGTMTYLNSSYFVSLEKGWGVGDWGVILKTTNSGLTWVNQPSGTDQSFYTVAFANDAAGIVAGDSGLIYRTSDGGTNWLRRTTPVEVTMYGSLALNKDTMFVVGDESAIFRSFSGGLSWSNLSKDLPITLTDVKFYNRTTGFATGSDGNLLKTTNGGLTWTPKSTGVSMWLYALDIASDGTVFAVGDFGAIIKSTTAGETWEDLSLETTTSYYGVVFYSSSVGWAVGDDGEIIATTDGGESWEIQHNPSFATLNDIQLIRTAGGAILVASGIGSTVVCATYGGFPVKYWTGAVDADWNNPANWNPTGVPVQIDSIIIPSGTRRPEMTITAQQVNLGSLTVAAGASLRIGSQVTQIRAKNGIVISGTVQLDAGAHTEFQSGGDLVISGEGRVTGGTPTYLAFGRGRLQGDFPSLVVAGGADLQSAGNVTISGALRLMSWITFGAYDTLSILNGAAESFTGIGVIRGGTVKRRIAAGSKQPYRFESPATVVQFLGAGTNPDSIAITPVPESLPPNQDDSVFVRRTINIKSWGGTNPPANIVLGFLESESSIPVHELGLFRDSSGLILNLGSSTWMDDPAYGVALDSTPLFSTWYIGKESYIPISPFQFFNYLKIGDAGGVKDSLSWGSQLGASVGLDAVFGETPLGSIPSAGTFDARWRLDASTTARVNIRPELYTVPSNFYRCDFQAGPAGFPITFRWDSTLLCRGDFFFRDAATGGTKFSVNMKLHSSWTVADPTVRAVEIYHRKPRYYAFQSAWNMFSYPMRVTTSATVEYNIPGAASSIYLFNNGYYREDTLVNGLGYWVKMRKAVNLGFEGDTLTSVTIPVEPGWNLVGALTNTIPVTSIAQNPPGLFSNPPKFYRYSTGYYLSDSLFGGMGFWIKSSGAGTLTLNQGFGKPADAAPVTASLAAYHALTIADQAGGAQTLYFGAPAGTGDEELDMPPPPPSGVFDARFTSQHYVEHIPVESGSALLRLSVRNAVFPLTIAVQFLPADESTVVTVLAGNNTVLGTLSARHQQPVVIESEPAEPLMLRVQSEGSAFPKVFALHQNYPNPFNPSTTVRFALPQQVSISLKVYNLLGQEVATLISRQEFSAGVHEAVFDGAGFGSGVYFCRLTANAVDSHRLLYSETRKLLLVK